MIRSVTTQTPLRVSLAGGGTDIDAFSRRFGGAVVSSAIDKYVHVIVRRHSPLFNEAYRLNYSQSEHVQGLDEIQNGVARECLRLVHVDPPLHILVAGDLPEYAGMGGSSAFAVGLLHGLHALRGESVCAAQLAEEACHVEIDCLSAPIGRQDQWCAAQGGLNYISFERNGRITLDPLVVPEIDKLFSHARLFWTGVQRNANAVLHDVRDNMVHREEQLQALKATADLCRQRLLKRPLDIRSIGELLTVGWVAKRALADSVSSNDIDHANLQALDAGGFGSKLCGGGGGGFVLVLARPERFEAIKTALGMPEVVVRHEPRGSRVIAAI